MATANTFEDLECWQEARMLVKSVFLACETGRLSKDYATSSQLKRAALSIMNNIAEGFGRKGQKDFLRFLEAAHGSALELKSMTYVLDDLEYLPMGFVEALRSKTDRIKRMIRGLMKRIDSKEKSTVPLTSNQQND